MNVVWVIIIMAALAGGIGLPILEVGIAVFAIVYGVQALTRLLSSESNDTKPRKRKRLKIVEEDD